MICEHRSLLLRLILAVGSVIPCARVASPLLVPWSVLAAQLPRSGQSVRAVITVSPAEVAAHSQIALAPTASVTFGGSADTSEVEFSQSAGYHVMLLLRDERILILDGGRAHVMTKSGRLLRTIGREGSGPAEFRALAGACVSAADSIRLFDATLERISVLDASASYVRSIDVSRAGVMYPMACFRDGRTLLARTEVTADRQLVLALRIADRDGNVTRELPRQPLGAPLPAIFRGRVSAFVAADRAVVAMAGKGTVTEFGLDGSVLRVLSLRSLAPRLLESDGWRVLEFSLPGTASAAQRAAIRERYAAMERPRSWPAFERVIPDGADGFWVELSNSGGSREEEWLHFDAAWRLTKRLRFPPSARSGRTVVGFDRSAVFVREFDADGFVTISRRAFDPTAVPPAR